MLNSIISGGQSGDLGYEADVLEMEINEHVDDLVVALYAVDSNLVVAVLPNVEAMLEVDDVATRVRGVKLLTWILRKSTEAQVADNERMLSAVVQRINDTAPEVRLEVTRMAGWALYEKNAPRALGDRVLAPHSAGNELSLLEIALSDGDLSVRSEAVEIVAKLLNPTDTDADDRAFAHPRLVAALGERMRDRDAAVVARAMEGLAWAFNRRVTNQWAAGGDDEGWCAWIPDTLLLSALAAHSAADSVNLAFARLTLLDQAVFGKREETKNGRARVVARVWAACSPKARDVLTGLVFKQRRDVQQALTAALARRSAKDAKAAFAKAVACVPESQGRSAADSVWALVRFFSRRTWLTQVRRRTTACSSA